MNFPLIAPYFAIKTKYQPNKARAVRLSTHFHSYWQMVVVTSGSGFITIEDADYPVSVGDVVLFAPHVSHSLFVTDVAMTTYEFKFDIKDDYLHSLISDIPIITKSAGEDIITLSRRAVHEARNAERHAEHYVAYIIAEIIVLLSRLHTKKEEDALLASSLNILSGESQDLCANAIRKYIENNYANDISTQDIADTLFLSTSYVCKKFTSAYKISPMKYISLLRLNKAKQLLESTKLSITEIATLVGFADLHYFSRSFKHYTGISPGEYRAGLQDMYTVSF